MKIKEILNRLESLAPLSLQETYDNSGLIIGNPETQISKALICIDITEKVINEAISKKCNLIISHHPLIFGCLTNIIENNPLGKCIIKAIRNDISIYAMHTNLDNAINGVNSMLCKKLGISKCKILKPKKYILKKLVTFCPSDNADIVRTALFNAGAGHIGNYDCCSYNSDGFGTFRALENTNPYVGEKNKLHFENEVKIETIYPAYNEKALIEALLSSHPYEEVAYDIFHLQNEFSLAGEGMIGDLKDSCEAKEFLQKVKSILGISVIKHSKLIKKSLKKVAVCGGSGSYLIKDALSADADIYITADIKYHQFFEGNGKMIIADVGHYESEQFAKEIIVDFLNENFPTFAFIISKINTNPVNYF